MRLNQLSDNEGSRKLKKRVGRGIGSGMGKQSTRGGKGQTARAGSSINGFEGGQMPLHMRMPKRGFKMYGRLKFAEVTLARLQRAFDAGHFKSGDAVDAAKLVAAGVIKRSYDGIRVLAGGDLKAKANLTVAGITASARKSVEGAGGSITLLQLHKVYEPVSQRGKKRRAEGRTKKKAAAED